MQCVDQVTPVMMPVMPEPVTLDASDEETEPPMPEAWAPGRCRAVPLEPPMPEAWVPGRCRAVPLPLPSYFAMEESSKAAHEIDLTVESQKCKCRSKCCAQVMQKMSSKIFRDQLHEMRQEIHQRTSEKNNQRLFALLKEMRPESEDGLQMFGVKVCRPVLQSILKVGKGRLHRMLEHISWGGLTPPADLRSSNGGSHHHETKSLDADAYLNYLYQNVAVDGPEPDDDACVELFEPGMGAKIYEWVEGHTNPCAKSCIGLDGEKVSARYLPYCSWVEFYEGYLYHGSADMKENKASKKCFLSRYHNYWRDKLIHLPPPMHQDCKLCAHLMKLRRCHPDENEREAANNALQQHLERNKADRCVDKRLEHL